MNNDLDTKKDQEIEKILSEKKIEDLIPIYDGNSLSYKKEEIQDLIKISEEHKEKEEEEFFSVNQDHESLNQSLMRDYKPEKINITDEYLLTEHSSNESSNDGRSYIFQWKDDFSPEKKNENTHFNNNNSVFYDFSMNSVNFIQNTNNSINFVSQENNFFNPNSMFFSNNFMNSQNFCNQTMNFAFKKQKDPFILDSPRKNKPIPKKRLYCNSKIVPEWASDLNNVKNSIIEQHKMMNPNNIFGEFIIDNLDLGSIFDMKKESYNPMNRFCI